MLKIIDETVKAIGEEKGVWVELKPLGLIVGKVILKEDIDIFEENPKPTVTINVDEIEPLNNLIQGEHKATSYWKDNKHDIYIPKVNDKLNGELTFIFKNHDKEELQDTLFDWFGDVKIYNDNIIERDPEDFLLSYEYVRVDDERIVKLIDVYNDCCNRMRQEAYSGVALAYDQKLYKYRIEVQNAICKIVEALT